MEGTQYCTKEAVLKRAQEAIGIPLRDIDKTPPGAMPLLQDPYKPGDLLRRSGGWDGDSFSIRHPCPAHRLQGKVLPEALLQPVSSGQDPEPEVGV